MNSQKNYPQGIIVRDEISNLHGAAPQTMAFKAFGSPKKDKKESQQQQQVQVNQTTLSRPFLSTCPLLIAISIAD